MREMTNDELTLYEIIKNNKDASNYELVKKMYSTYGIELPDIPKDLPSIWTIERQIRLLKQTYPNALTSQKERQIKAEKVSEYKDMALDKNKPMLPRNGLKQEQVSLGLFGESWW